MPKSAGNSNVEKLKTGEAKLLILLVGINQYDDTRINNLNYCVNDCQELKAALQSATKLFTNKTIIVHHDNTSEFPLLDVVKNSLEKLVAQATKEDTILIYFFCHGFLDKQTQPPILCLKNTETNNLATTGLPVAEILQKLAESGAKYQLIFIDACHSGGTSINFQHLSESKKLSESETSSIAPQLIELFWQRAAKSKGFYALLSCDKYEQSEEWKNLKHGLFTYYLIQGFLGKAADKSGVIEADSLYKYVYHRTLEYIDKTNQQIRLTNQQKANRGESNIQSESPGQTPLRIVEGAGEFVLGIVPINSCENSRRQAVIINGLAGCDETVSLSGVLHSRGDFIVGYWPRTDSSWQGVKGVKAGILECLNISSPSSHTDHTSRTDVACNVPTHPDHTSHTSHTQLETAFLHIRGEVETIINDDNEHEHYLVLGDGVRISCFWLQRQLWNSQVRQQVIILDFPNAENNVLTQWVEYLHQEKNKSQCIIASSSLEFSQELVKILGNARHGLTVAGLVIELQQRLKITTYLSGNAIDVLLPGEATNTIFDANICPYKGLSAFRQQDAEFFFGRQKLIQKILARLRDSSFLAVVGASGSGKSSVVQAGVLPQLAAGKQPPGKCLCCCFRPSDFISGKTEKTEKTLINALAQALATDGKVDEMEGLLHFGVQGLVLWLRRRVEPMVVLVVDQFEELFTLTAEKERLEFLNLLLGALRETSDKLRLIITLRDDFIGNCLEVPELEVLVQENLMLVSPNLQEVEYRDAIVKPAEKVGLKVESGLVDVLLDGVQEELGGLPLLQFVLWKLWKNRRDGILNLQVYQEVVKGFKQVLQEQAEEVLAKLQEIEKSCAQFIFLELVHPGQNGKEDTRRRVLKSELLGKKYGKEVMESVLKNLSDARLIVVGGKVESKEKGENLEEKVAESVEENLGELEITVEVAHEILIRHWSTLRLWLDKNRTRLQEQREIDDRAKKWKQVGQVDGSLLRDVELEQAEKLYIKYKDELSEDSRKFIEAGIDLRRRDEEERQQQEKKERERLQKTIVGFVASRWHSCCYFRGA
ncbi:MAG: caspase family protein [Cyanobacteria bacterium P01_H01_bin.35]